jgi:hypothetical protein
VAAEGAQGTGDPMVAGSMQRIGDNITVKRLRKRVRQGFVFRRTLEGWDADVLESL